MNAFKQIFVAVVVVVTSFSAKGYAQQYNPTNIPVTTVTSDQGSPAIAVDPNNPNRLIATWDDHRNSSYTVP